MPWLNVPGVGAVHVKLAAPRKRKCAHCGEDAAALCDWKMIKPVKFTSVDELEIGDVITQAHGWRARILSITLGPPAQVFPSRWGFCGCALLLNRGSGVELIRPLEISVVFDDWSVGRLRVERPGTCDKPCCFRCRRHVGPDRDYCRDHWDQQVPAPGEPLRAAVPAGVRIRSGRDLDRANQRRLFE